MRKVKQTQDPFKVVLDGFLKKYSPALFKGWQKRRVHVENHELRYYKEGSDKEWKELAGCINFDLYKCDVKLSDKEKTGIDIKITGTDRVF